MSPNFTKGRENSKIQGFVIHMTEGTFESGVSWCENPISRVSYHYIIAKSGANYNLVDVENTAWHAGLIKDPQTDFIKHGANPNLYSVGIAMAGFANVGPNIMQIAECARLLREISQKYGIMLDKSTVIPHHDIRADKSCPGPYTSIDSLIYLANLPL